MPNYSKVTYYPDDTTLVELVYGGDADLSTVAVFFTRLEIRNIVVSHGDIDICVLPDGRLVYRQAIIPTEEQIAYAKAVAEFLLDKKSTQYRILIGHVLSRNTHMPYKANTK